ncbi:hypothetical protein GSY71_08080 [Pusillimonas sp. TS35]|nr:hypothetical protein [Pusillimonas sp. TS35]
MDTTSRNSNQALVDKVRAQIGAYIRSQPIRRMRSEDAAAGLSTEKATDITRLARGLGNQSSW